MTVVVAVVVFAIVVPMVVPAAPAMVRVPMVAMAMLSMRMGVLLRLCLLRRQRATQALDVLGEECQLRRVQKLRRLLDRRDERLEVFELGTVE